MSTVSTDVNQLLYPRLTLTRKVEDYAGKASAKQYEGRCSVCRIAFTGRDEKKYCSDYCKDKAAYLRNDRMKSQTHEVMRG